MPFGKKKGGLSEQGAAFPKKPIFDDSQTGDASSPVPAKKGPTKAPASQGTRKGPRAFRRTGLTRVPANAMDNYDAKDAVGAGYGGGWDSGDTE